MANSNEGYDYENMYKVFSKVCENIGLTMIELNGNGNQPPSPFVTFDIISPYINLNFLEDDMAHSFECVISFTIYSKNSKIEALNLADKLRQELVKQANTDIYRNEEIVLVERMPTQIRYVEETNNYAYMVGFDTRLRLKEPYTQEVDEITDIPKF